MSTVDLMTSNQAQSNGLVLRCQKSEKDTHHPSEKGTMIQLQKNLKQSKRKIIKDIEKFEAKEAQGYGAEHIQIILKHIENIDDRFRKFENNVEKFQNFIINDWEEGDDEEIDKLLEQAQKESIKYSDYVWEFTKRSHDIIHHIESSAHENKFNLTSTLAGKDSTSTLAGKETNNFNNLIKLNSNTNGTYVNITEKQDELEQLREAEKETKILKDKLKMYEEATECKYCNFTVTGKMKISKYKQKLKAHVNKEHKIDIASMEVALGSVLPDFDDESHTGLDIAYCSSCTRN